MKKINFCASINEAHAELLENLKTELGANSNRDLLHKLADFYFEKKERLHNFRNAELTVSQRLEQIICSMLDGCEKIKGVTVAAKYAELYETNPNRNNLSNCIALYAAEIEMHNKKVFLNSK